MDYKEVYEQWIANPYFDEATKEELKSIAEDENEIKERFYMDLEFGTAGLRGIIGAGTNRMNIYVVRRATQGLANYIAKVDKKSQGVAIAYDSRHMSPEFAQEAALCLAANGIKAYIFETLRPTPELSFAVRHLGCVAGINVTASHNPPEYNGYKVYWAVSYTHLYISKNVRIIFPGTSILWEWQCSPECVPRIRIHRWVPVLSAMITRFFPWVIMDFQRVAQMMNFRGHVKEIRLTPNICM